MITCGVLSHSLLKPRHPCIYLMSIRKRVVIILNPKLMSVVISVGQDVHSFLVCVEDVTQVRRCRIRSCSALHNLRGNKSGNLKF